MSPTSYQTAPPRDNLQIIGIETSGVKQIINKINHLQSLDFIVPLVKTLHY
jgi:hypothetical protein